ncbi:hypothetical protein AOQ84DRAFT_404003, partial [Glonium stellatum]
MPFTSPFPSLDIPKVNLLSYLFPEDENRLNGPIWIDAKDPAHHLTSKTMLHWTKRLAL